MHANMWPYVASIGCWVFATPGYFCDDWLLLLLLVCVCVASPVFLQEHVVDPFTSTLHSSLMSDMFSSLFSSPTFSNHSQLQVMVGGSFRCFCAPCCVSARVADGAPP